MKCHLSIFSKKRHKELTILCFENNALAKFCKIIFRIHTHYCKLAGRKSNENEVFPVYSTKYANKTWRKLCLQINKEICVLCIATDFKIFVLVKYFRYHMWIKTRSIFIYIVSPKIFMLHIFFHCFIFINTSTCGFKWCSFNSLKNPNISPLKCPL